MKCCDMSTGKLRHKITIERLTDTPDGAGGGVRTWATVATPRAEVRPLSANERYAAMRIEANTTHSITIRYQSGFTPADRVNYNGRIMQVTGMIDVEEAHRWLQILATEGEPT